MNEPEFNRTEGWQSPASAEDGTHTHRHYRQADKRQERSNHHLTISSALGAFANSFGDMQVLGIKLHRPPPSPTHPRACHIGVDVMHSNLFWSDGGRHQLRGLATNVGKGKDSEARQRKAIEGYAKSAGMVIVDWFYDAAVRGADTITERPGFAAMLDRIASNGVRACSALFSVRARTASLPACYSAQTNKLGKSQLRLRRWRNGLAVAPVIW
jgi:hypothetical protein